MDSNIVEKVRILNDISMIEMSPNKQHQDLSSTEDSDSDYTTSGINIRFVSVI
jgi:hypothetical protein